MTRTLKNLGILVVTIVVSFYLAFMVMSYSYGYLMGITGNIDRFNFELLYNVERITFIAVIIISYMKFRIRK